MTEQKSSSGTPEQPLIQPTQFDPEDEYRPSLSLSRSPIVGWTAACGSVSHLHRGKLPECAWKRLASWVVTRCKSFASRGCGKAGRRAIAVWTPGLSRGAGTSCGSGLWSFTGKLLINLASEQRMLQTRRSRLSTMNCARDGASCGFSGVQPVRGRITMGQAISTTRS